MAPRYRTATAGGHPPAARYPPYRTATAPKSFGPGWRPRSGLATGGRAHARPAVGGEGLGVGSSSTLPKQQKGPRVGFGSTLPKQQNPFGRLRAGSALPRGQEIAGFLWWRVGPVPGLKARNTDALGARSRSSSSGQAFAALRMTERAGFGGPALQGAPAAPTQVENPFGKLPPSLKLWRAGRASSAPPYNGILRCAQNDNMGWQEASG